MVFPSLPGDHRLLYPLFLKKTGAPSVNPFLNYSPKERLRQLMAQRRGCANRSHNILPSGESSSSMKEFSPVRTGAPEVPGMRGGAVLAWREARWVVFHRRLSACSRSCSFIAFTSAVKSSRRRSIWRNLSVTRSSFADERRIGLLLRRGGLRPRLRDALLRGLGRGGLRTPLLERATSDDGLLALGPLKRAITS